MTTKEKLLKNTYKTFIDSVLGGTDISGVLDEIVDPDIIGFGTTVDEKIFSYTAFQTMLKNQKEQSAGIDISYKCNLCKQHTTSTGNTAVFADDVSVTIMLENEPLEMYIRVSTVLEYRESKWVVITFHGSKPEYVNNVDDTFGINVWKQKNKELEKIVAERTAQLMQQKEELVDTLQKLQSSQTQLIQSEKMASLGELTAGIAHEIQNPLNFVNNFSEVSAELLAEMKTELETGNTDNAKEIADDVIQNLEKINHHGKRADAIVKGMLQHSRSSSTIKEPTDLNALCDEYLRLSYHGLRAKDKSFNATMNTDFDESIENVNIIPQDFGRVILNLLTNAFYVVNEKKQLNLPNYEPTVSITTKKENDKIIIQVSDNGNGMPQEIVDKIFQPFFTTKPTGKGTGLGLSMSYDIITKGHNGALKVASTENQGTTFSITISK